MYHIIMSSSSQYPAEEEVFHIVPRSPRLERVPEMSPGRIPFRLAMTQIEWRIDNFSNFLSN